LEVAEPIPKVLQHLREAFLIVCCSFYFLITYFAIIKYAKPTASKFLTAKLGTALRIKLPMPVSGLFLPSCAGVFIFFYFLVFTKVLRTTKPNNTSITFLHERLSLQGASAVGQILSPVATHTFLSLNKSQLT
jgi:TRAP-type C4-dicarboxylate transport system permease small subunit